MTLHQRNNKRGVDICATSRLFGTNRTYKTFVLTFILLDDDTTVIQTPKYAIRLAMNKPKATAEFMVLPPILFSF